MLRLGIVYVPRKVYKPAVVLNLICLGGLNREYLIRCKNLYLCRKDDSVEVSTTHWRHLTVSEN